MDKYYTPSIKEFHVGFEYEFKTLNSWESRTIDIEDLASSYANPDGIEQHLKDDRIRVKYLDQKDIESLGFNDKKKTMVDWYSLEKRVEDNYSTYGYWQNFHLVHSYSRKTIKIIAYEYSLGKEGVTLFQGKIKNKSELKRLLKQLNIL